MSIWGRNLKLITWRKNTLYMGRILHKSQDMDDKNGINMNKIIIIVIIITITLSSIVVDYIDNI